VELYEIVEAISRSYARRCWWADREDLEQEAWVAALSARDKWDARRGVPLGAFAWKRVMWAVRDYVLVQSSPVTGIHSNPQRLRGLMRSELPAHLPAPAAGMSEATLERAISRARRVILDGRRGDLAVEVLIDGRKPREVARDKRIDRCVVHTATTRARTRLRRDPVLRNMMEE
jgi:hypothetical protein